MIDEIKNVISVKILYINIRKIDEILFNKIKGIGFCFDWYNNLRVFLYE